MSTRKVIEQIKARKTSDGDGVNLLRVFGGAQPERFDPFLLLDEFGSESADDYIGGFPPHPHRGFETLTYMLNGKMEHRDHMGNVGLLNDGDVQRMTAGRGIIHSEMPKQTEGKMRGMQLWLNLPAAKKMQPASYEDVDGDSLPVYELDGAKVKAIAGAASINEQAIQGYFSDESTAFIYFDIELVPGGKITLPLDSSHNALIYTFEGEVNIGEASTRATQQTLSRLNRDGNVVIENTTPENARLIMLAGKPIEEPIVQYGPFVMNSAKEIDDAIHDYREGKLTA